MSERTDYRTRALTVRGRARAQLSAIRKERLARKRLATHDEAGPTPWPFGASPCRDDAARVASTTDALVPPDKEAHPGPSPDTSCDRIGVPQAPDANAEDPGQSIVARDPDAAATPPAPNCAGPTGTDEVMPPAPDDPPEPNLPGTPTPEACAVDTAAPMGAGEGTDVRDGPGPNEGLRDPEEPPTEHVGGPAASPVAEAEADASDLHEIPGIGSGLVWLLQSAGVLTLADLASADIHDLRVRLGVVGRLLDLEDLAAYARAHVEAVAPREPAES